MATTDWPTDFDDVPIPAGFCDVYEIHERHTYTALNRDSYHCTGVVQADLDSLGALARDTCEHGMAAYLCAGPGHYPADR